MLSYQHIYHAGNLADVHKHSVLACVLSYLTQKEKPLTYLETHSGRARYELDSVASQKTGEAAKGILGIDLEAWFEADHPYRRLVTKTQAAYGTMAYPGSPWIASMLLRARDSLQLAELHPAEAKILIETMGNRARVHQKDGYVVANAICPPTPRRGFMLVDPSYEVKAEYTQIPAFFSRIADKWNVGVLMLWYPILVNSSHIPMIRELKRRFPDVTIHEVGFPAACDNHGMIGSGVLIVNSPYGLKDELLRLSDCFRSLSVRI